MSMEQPRLLDVGCGDGRYASRKGWVDEYQYLGVDIDPNRVKTAQARGLDVRQHDVLDGLPFDDGAFDRVVAKAILEHVTDPLAAAEECRRVLAPKGTFIAIVPSDRSYDVWGDYTHLRAFRSDAFADLLTDAGFQRLTIKPRMGWQSVGGAVKSIGRILAPWTPYGYPRAWVATARGDGRAD